MKEERLTVLRLLEKGIISAAEAERLLHVLQNTDTKDRLNKEEISTTITSTLNKAGDILGSFVHTVGEKAEDAAKEVEPFLKKMASTVAEKAEDVKTYAEKIKRDFAQEAEEKMKKEPPCKQDIHFECPLQEKYSDKDSSIDEFRRMAFPSFPSKKQSVEIQQDEDELVTFEQRVVCDRDTPCCGKADCNKPSPCCADENICKKEVPCCGKDENLCNRAIPCCWDNTENDDTPDCLKPKEHN